MLYGAATRVFKEEHMGKKRDWLMIMTDFVLGSLGFLFIVGVIAVALYGWFYLGVQLR